MASMTVTDLNMYRGCCRLTNERHEDGRCVGPQVRGGPEVVDVLDCHESALQGLNVVDTQKSSEMSDTRHCIEGGVVVDAREPRLSVT
jgi:hypothetical protein